MNKFLFLFPFFFFSFLSLFSLPPLLLSQIFCLPLLLLIPDVLISPRSHLLLILLFLISHTSFSESVKLELRSLILAQRLRTESRLQRLK